MTLREALERHDVVSRVICAAEWASEGAVGDAIAVLLDLEDELLGAIDNEEAAANSAVVALRRAA